MNISELTSASSRATSSLWSSFKWGASGTLIGMPLVAFEVSKARRGEAVSTLAGQTASLMALPVTAGFASAAICLIPGIGVPAAVFMGTILAAYPDDILGKYISRSVRYLTQANTRVRHLEMGGNYEDTQLASRQRFLAVRDMNAAFMSSRRYLGQEARFMR